MPSTTDGIPSTRNSHCQPARPKCGWSISHPDSGLPTTNDTTAATMKTDTVRDR